MRSSFIICTRDRPDELLRCVRSIADQDTLPDEIVIVDASQPSINRTNGAQVAKLTAGTGIATHYHATTRACLPYQRNLGVEISTGDILFFVDDDVILLPDFHRAMLDVYMTYHESEVGGIQGTAINILPSSFKYRLYRHIFLPGRRSADLAQVVHPSGDAYVKRAAMTGVVDVEWMNGGCMSFRRDVFNHFHFDETLDGYAAGEDIDFTYRVSRQYRLLRALSARVIHTESTVSRLSLGQLAEMRTVNRHYLFRKNMPQSRVHRLAYLWASVGHLAFSVGLSVKYRNVTYLTGTLQGIIRIMQGDIPGSRAPQQGRLTEVRDT